MHRGIFLLSAMVLVGNLLAAHAQPSPSLQVEPEKKENTAIRTTSVTGSATATGAASLTIPDKTIATKGDKEAGGLFNGWAIGDKIAAIVAFFAFLQFLGGAATYFVMRDTAHRQLRAYVLPQDAGIFDGTTLNPAQPGFAGHPCVGTRFYNNGQTPAYNVVPTIAVAIIPIAQENDALNIQLPRVGPPFALNVGISTVRNIWSPIAITPAEMAGITSSPPTHAIYMFGRVEYEDIFKGKHFSNLRYRYTGVWPPVSADSFLLCDAGNDSN